MSEQQDPRIVAMFQQAAPPARDALFRIQVLERRERREFQGRMLTITLGGGAILLLALAAILRGETDLDMTGVLVAAGTLACACWAFRRSLRILRHFRV
jgi:hypothetical protein